MSFADFKKRVKSGDNFKKIQSKIEQESGEDYTDDRYWKFEVDSSGSGMAVVRLLPEPEGEDFPFVMYYEHAFQGPTDKWYIERSLTSLGKGTPDPVAEVNRELWETGTEANQNIVKKRKRHKRYVSNIYVINDPKNPENNGKVMLWKYGPALHNIIQDAIKPPEEFDEDPINPFDLWDGADFKIKAYIDSYGYRKYDKSGFSEKKPLLDGDDAKLEQVYKSLHSLEAEVSPDKYKSYDELKEHLDRVLGNTKSASKPVEDENHDTETSLSDDLEEVTNDTDDLEDYESLLDD